MKKRLVYFLIFTMILSLIPFQVFANNKNDTLKILEKVISIHGFDKEMVAGYYTKDVTGDKKDELFLKVIQPDWRADVGNMLTMIYIISMDEGEGFPVLEEDYEGEGPRMGTNIIGFSEKGNFVSAHKSSRGNVYRESADVTDEPIIEEIDSYAQAGDAKKIEALIKKIKPIPFVHLKGGLQKHRGLESESTYDKINMLIGFSIDRDLKKNKLENYNKTDMSVKREAQFIVDQLSPEQKMELMYDPIFFNYGKLPWNLKKASKKIANSPTFEISKKDLEKIKGIAERGLGKPVDTSGLERYIESEKYLVGKKSKHRLLYSEVEDIFVYEDKLVLRGVVIGGINETKIKDFQTIAGCFKAVIVKEVKSEWDGYRLKSVTYGPYTEEGYIKIK